MNIERKKVNNVPLCVRIASSGQLVISLIHIQTLIFSHSYPIIVLGLSPFSFIFNPLSYKYLLIWAQLGCTNFTVLGGFGQLDFCVLTIGVVYGKGRCYYGFILSSHGQLGAEQGGVSWYYFEKLCVSSFNHSSYIITKNDLVVFRQKFSKLKHVLQTVYNHETCISPTPINYATYWDLAHSTLQQFYR